jgi:hypothetical protein
MGCLKLPYKKFTELVINVFSNKLTYIKTKKSLCKDYNFSFQTQERVDEITGAGNHTTALFWEYDTRLGRRWNRDPIIQPYISDYATFGNNPIYNTDVLGNIIAPWWLKNTKNEVYPGTENYQPYISPYKNFLSQKDLDQFTSTALSLMKSSDIFKKVYLQLDASKEVYQVKQLYQTSITADASYSSSTNTVKLFYFGASKGGLFEEVFHAGQDDYYTKLGIKRNNLADEVEAKAANLLEGFSDASAKGNYSSITNYFKTGKKDDNYNGQVENLITEVYNSYAKANGEEWAKKNKPSDISRKDLFKYLSTLTKKEEPKKK